MASKSKENLAIMALVDQNQEIKEILESHGHQVGQNYMAPKAIASLALLNTLSKKGIDFNYAIDVFKRGFEAKKQVVVKVGKDEEEIHEYDDTVTQMKSVEMFMKLMGLNNGIETDAIGVTQDLLPSNRVELRFANDEEIKPPEDVDI